MQTSDRPTTPRAELTVAELEARFEMEAVPLLPGAQPGTDWSCACSFLF